jgi:[ribosomal protein S5]-alanine N-acetyltransferase
MVTARPIREEDADAVQTLAADPAVTETTLMPAPYPEGGAREFIRRSLGQREAGTDFVFAIVAGERLVGVCGIHDIGGRPPSAELGYWVGRPHWGRGYASAAAGQVVRWSFQELPVARLTARCLERNGASRHVLEKLGFELRGTEPNTYPKWRPTDVILQFELTREAWSFNPLRT